MWKQIAAAKARLAPKQRKLLSVETVVDGITHLLTKQDDMESAIMDKLDGRFCLTHGSPFLDDSPFSQALGFLGNTDTANQILHGTFVPPASLDPHTSALIALIHSYGTTISHKLLSSTITT